MLLWQLYTCFQYSSSNRINTTEHLEGFLRLKKKNTFENIFVPQQFKDNQNFTSSELYSANFMLTWQLNTSFQYSWTSSNRINAQLNIWKAFWGKNKTLLKYFRTTTVQGESKFHTFTTIQGQLHASMTTCHRVSKFLTFTTIQGQLYAYITT